MSKLKIFGRGRKGRGRKKSFLKDESGASAVEYGLVLALVSAGMVAIFGSAEGTGTGFLGELKTKMIAIARNIETGTGTGN